MKIQADLTSAAINLKRLGAASFAALSGTWVAHSAAQGPLQARHGDPARNKPAAIAAA